MSQLLWGFFKVLRNNLSERGLLFSQENMWRVQKIDKALWVSQEMTSCGKQNKPCWESLKHFKHNCTLAGPKWSSQGWVILSNSNTNRLVAFTSPGLKWGGEVVETHSAKVQRLSEPFKHMSNIKETLSFSSEWTYKFSLHSGCINFQLSCQ